MKHVKRISVMFVVIASLFLGQCSSFHPQAQSQGPAGPAGPAGPTGPQGPIGPQGSAGISTVYTTSTIQNNITESSPTNTGANPPVSVTVATLTLPAGAFSLSANVQFLLSGNPTTAYTIQTVSSCTIGPLNNTVNVLVPALAQSVAGEPFSGINVDVPIQGTLTLATPTAVNVVCQVTSDFGESPNGGAYGSAFSIPASVSGVQFQAVQVTNVVQQ